MSKRATSTRPPDPTGKVVTMNGVDKPSEELVKLRATVARLQGEMEDIIRARDRFESDLKRSLQECSELREENARLLAQADARAALMQTIQSTLARPYNIESGEEIEGAEYAEYDEDSLVYSGIDCEDEGDGVYEEADEVVGETTQPDQHSVLPVREVYLPEQALPSPALTGTSSLGSFPRPRSPPVSLEGPPEDLATVQDPPTPEDLPKTEEPPASGNLELFITEARPVGEEMPVVVELPPVQESPAVDESLVIEEPPSIEEPPVAEELLIVEEPRTAEESLVAEQPPFIEEPPIVEGLLTNEGVAFPMDGLAMKEGHPLLDEEPLRQNAPSQEELFVSGASPTLSNRTTSSVQDELPVQIEESPPQESTTLATTAIVEELVASEDFPSPVQESESKSASPAEHLHPSFDLPDEEPFSELSSLADNVSVARSGTEDETSEENSGDESHSDDSLSSLSDFDGDSQAANDPNGPRRSKRSRTHVASYNYRRRKRPRRDKEENASSSTPPAGDSISAAGSGSRGRTLSAKAEDRPTASGDFSKQRKKHQPGYFTARQRRQTLADQKRRVELAEEVADWPFRTKKAGAYSNWIMCDHCKRWAHHGCAGIIPNDPRLEANAKYICPPCDHGHVYKRKPGRAGETKCFRPDCDH